jgi:RNase P subunit RPR2
MAFMDMREWMSLLEKAGELRRVAVEIDWNREIGAVARRVLEKKGPALLFENIKGYSGGRCTRLFVSGLSARSRLDSRSAFRVVATGPVKECIIRGDAIDQTEFPVPIPISSRLLYWARRTVRESKDYSEICSHDGASIRTSALWASALRVVALP